MSCMVPDILTGLPSLRKATSPCSCTYFSVPSGSTNLCSMEYGFLRVRDSVTHLWTMGLSSGWTQPRKAS